MRRLLQTALCLAVFIGSAMSFAAQAQSEGPDVFKVSELNAGLGEPPARLDRSTPRASLEAFLGPSRWASDNAISHLLDLDAIPTSEQATRGPDLARKLAHVIERKIPVDFGAISDRPDAMDTQGSDRDPMVGVARKSIALGTLELDRWPVTIRINRLQVGEEAPVWVISRQTVEHIPALYEAFGPTPIEEAMPEVLRQQAFWGLMWWELIAFPLVFAIAGMIGAAIWVAIGRAAELSQHDGVRLGLERARLPVVLFALANVLHLTISSLFVFSAAAEATIQTAFWVMIVLALVFTVSRILDTLIDYTSDRYLDTIDDPQNTNAREWFTNLSAAKRLGVIATIVIGLAVAFNSLDVFSSFGLSLLVSAGVATAVFGLAAQAVLGNIFASLQLALAKPIRIGDAVHYEGRWAYVEKINYTYVQLRTWDQKRFIVPVKHFVSSPFENWTKSNPELIKPVLLKLDHRADVEALRRYFKKIALEDPDWAEDAEPKVQVIDQDEDGISVRFYCTAPNPTAAWNLHCRIRERLVAHLRELDEPSDLPRTRIAYVSNSTESETGEKSTYKEGMVEDTGEPLSDSIRDTAKAA
ncbi:MAG: mechanosensitive ion channel [Devosia sp.]